MAQFYYEYANYILQKIEANLDIFNEQAMPSNADEPNQPIMENVAEEYDSESDEQLDNPEEVK